MQETKICYKCKKELLLTSDNFSKNRARKDGWKNECKPCSKILLENYRINNKEKIAKTVKKYKELHKEKLKVDRKEYEKLNKEELAKSRMAYWELNKEKLIKKYKKYYSEHKENYKINRERYYKENREVLLKNAKEYGSKNKERRNKRDKERRKIDPGFRIRSNLSRRINQSLRFCGSKKSKKTIELLGCSIAELKNYLELKFEDGMSWNNYGKNGWHIDHIIPCVYFNLSTLEDQKKCFHYTNLQPLWEKDNFNKNGYYMNKNYRKTNINGTTIC